MAVDRAMVKQVRQQIAEAEAAGYDPDIEHLRPLASLAELLAYMLEVERRAGDEELGVDLAELLIRVADIDREQVREAEGVLRGLGYAALSARLRKLARRARPAADGPRDWMRRGSMYVLGDSVTLPISR
jgi:hypothetical protein